VLLASCVSKKKYVQLEQEHGQTKSQLTKTAVEKEELEAKFAKIEARVADYNSKINELAEENDAQFVSVDGAVISNDVKKQMRETLKNVAPGKLSEAKT
ncbi:MAG: cell envelope biogenesis protein OmpA, partial [Flavobacteriales bacterium]